MRAREAIGPDDDGVLIASFNTLLHITPRQFPFIAVDESHCLNSPSSDRSIKVAEFLDLNPEAIVPFLSGTPMTNEPASVHNQLDLLWNDRVGTLYQFSFRYCRHTENEHRPGGLDFSGVNDEYLAELQARMGAMSVRVTKSEVDAAEYAPLVTETRRIPERDVKAPVFKKDFEKYAAKVGDIKAKFVVEAALRQGLREYARSGVLDGSIAVSRAIPLQAAAINRALDELEGALPLIPGAAHVRTVIVP